MTARARKQKSTIETCSRCRKLFVLEIARLCVFWQEVIVPGRLCLDCLADPHIRIEGCEWLRRGALSRLRAGRP